MKFCYECERNYSGSDAGHWKTHKRNETERESY